MKRFFIFFLFAIPLLALADIPKSEENPVEEISPIEDLMREHGVLNRILLIYEEIIHRIETQKTFPMDAFHESIEIMQKFIENYHEKLEEDYVFVEFEKNGKMLDLVQTLRAQHDRGRSLTEFILSNSNSISFKKQSKKIKDSLHQFIRMYRPHEAREDTVLFPEFKNIVSKEKYSSLGDIFEEKEQELFGKEGFETIVQDVAEIEKKLDIYRLSQFTP